MRGGMAGLRKFGGAPTGYCSRSITRAGDERAVIATRSRRPPHGDVVRRQQPAERPGRDRLRQPLVALALPAA